MAASVHVELANRSYDIEIVSGEWERFPKALATWVEQVPHRKQESRTAFLITDSNVNTLHATNIQQLLQENGWTTRLATIDAGEQSKCQTVINGLYDQLVEMHADRQTVVIAIGGGVVGDASGFVAATYARGLPFVQVPTSLLAHVDSSVGGKVGINHARGKNLIGAFHQPLGVFIETETLKTLPAREYISGLAEVIKYGVILDAEFFEYLEQNVNGLNDRTPEVMQHIISRSCQLKADVVEHDEFERTGLRAVLNYGHTFAHVFEALAGYGELLHGEAVSIGMVYASHLAERLKLIDSEVTESQIELLKAVHLPTTLPTTMQFSTDDLLNRMLLDKKTVGGQLRFVLPTRMGNVKVFSDVPVETVTEILNELAPTKE